MNGRRRPIGVWNVSLQGPMTSGTVNANRPSAAITAAISVWESVNFCEQRREVGRGRRDRESEPERAEAEEPDERAIRPHRGASPSVTSETTVRSAFATSSSPSGSWPSTQPVRISSIAP